MTMKTRLLLSVALAAAPLFGQLTAIPNTDFPTFRTNLNNSLNLGVSTAGSYANPSWLTSLASGKLTGAVTVSNGGTGITAGTSGGVLYFSSSGAINSSATLSINLPLIGGGAGSPPTTGARSGNTTTFVTTTGSQTSGDCVSIDSAGNHIDSGVACASSTFATLGSGTNTTATLVIGAGASFSPTSATAGVVSANQLNGTSLASLITGLLHVTTTTGAVTSSLLVNADITNGTIDLSTKTTGILAVANGGTGTAFFAVAGPATSAKTFTFPNSNATVLTSASPVSIAQGGTGTASTLTGLVRGNSSAMTAAELSGDATTSGSNVVTVAKVNGITISGTPAVGYVPTATSTSAASWQLPVGVSVFTGSTAVTSSFAATPTFSLADVSAQSPVRFEPGALTSNVSAVTFTNKTKGAKFSIAWLQDGTGGRTVTYGASAANACPVDPTAGKITTQFFEVAADGTTVNGTGCVNNEAGVVDYGPTGSAPGTPATGNLACWYDSTDLTNECKDVNAVTTKMVRVISGTSALGTSAISTGTCATVVTTSAPGVLTTDAIVWSPNASIKAVTGYAPSTSGGLSIAAYPTADNVNFDICNWTSGTVTPGAVTLNWKVSH